MHKICSLILILIVNFSLFSVAHSQSTFPSSILFDKKVQGLDTTHATVRWFSGRKKVEISNKYFKSLGIKSISLADGQPNGIALRSEFEDGSRSTIPLDWPAATGCIDKHGEIRDGCFIDIALYDFDKDSIPEVVLSIADGLIEQTVFVLQYHPPLKNEHRTRFENWTSNILVGQAQCFIFKDSIAFKFGSRGFDDVYFFRDGGFYQQKY